jgi:hypothetical protein
LEAKDDVDLALSGRGIGWKHGQIEYCFSAEVSDVAQEAFRIAVERVQNQVPCLRFQELNRLDRTSCKSIPSIMVQSTEGYGCWSYVGQISGRDEAWANKSQPLNLGRGCEMVGIVMHQLGHALGMVHQNSRADRDQAVKMNEDNMQDKMRSHFRKFSDVTKYGWNGYDACPERSGRTRVAMNAGDCVKVGGFSEGGAHSVGDAVQCQLDICEGGTYFPAPANACLEKLATMAIRMHKRECRHAKGTAFTAEIPLHDISSLAGASETDWVDCMFDLCTDIGLQLAKPSTCENKLAYGYIQVSAKDCTSMEGTFSAEHAGVEWVDCYFDFCAEAPDQPFDVLSLMMWSPYAWSLTGKELTLEPLGNHSRILSGIMGQRMGFSASDILHLGHMHDCWEEVEPEFDTREINEKMLSGGFFEYEGICRDQYPEHSGFDVRTAEGFVKHASCSELTDLCNHDELGAGVRETCPVSSCNVCPPLEPQPWVLRA